MIDWSGLPKVELHCHLLGVISPTLLRRVQSLGGKTLISPESLDRMHPVRTVHAFRTWIEILRPYQATTPEFMQPILALHVESLVAQNVVYAELMLSPTMFPRERSAFFAAFRRWRDWALELERERIQIEFLMVFPRTLTQDVLDHDTEMFLDLKREGLICGVALVGLEDGLSIERFGRSFERWRDAGLGIEVHAGEHSGPESVWDALEHGRPHRLGHALSAFADAGLIEEIRRRDIHVEFSPTGNVLTGSVSSLGWHPIRHAKELNVRFSVNTDNPGAFDSSMDGEFEALREWGFTVQDFAKVFSDSLAARFQPKLRYPDLLEQCVGRYDSGS